MDQNLEFVEGAEEQQEEVVVRTPVERFRDQWAALGGPAILRQRSFILQNSDLLPYGEPARIKGWTPPLAFALLGVVLAAGILSAFNWLITRDKGKQSDEIIQLHADVAAESHRIKGVIEAFQAGKDRVERSRKSQGFAVGTSGPVFSKDDAEKNFDQQIEEAHQSETKYKYDAALMEKRLHALGDAWALFYSGTPVMLALALVFCAQFVRAGIQSDYGRYRMTRQADDFYLYYAGAYGLWIMPGLVVLLHLLLSSHAWGMSAFFDGGGFLIKCVLWVGAYGLLAWLFLQASMQMYKALLIPAPRLEDVLQNRILLRMHLGFAGVFAVLLAALGALCAGVFLLQKTV
jgi:hypothetical protein